MRYSARIYQIFNKFKQSSINIPIKAH